MATLLVEDHPLSETRTTKNTDSAPSTDGHIPKNVHIMWESHSSRSYNALAASLSATFGVYRTISCASGLFNVVIQAEHNCVPPSDRRLRTSSLLTKKGGKKARHTEVRPGSPRGRNLSLSSSSCSTSSLSSSSSSYTSTSSSFTLPFLPARWKRKVQRIMAVLSLCKRGMGDSSEVPGLLWQWRKEQKSISLRYMHWKKSVAT